MILKLNLEMLAKLKANNNREWFSENKKAFQKEENQVKIFFKEIFEELSKIDDLDKMQIFRIYRDVRFSKDKSPYKAHFSVGFVRQKPQLRGGYYLHIENDSCFVGGGFWEPNKEDLNRIRKELSIDASELREIIAQKEFKHYFGTLQGEELKTAPRDFDKNHPNIDLIKKKQYLISRSFSTKEVESPQFNEEIIATFKAMRPFFNYMSDVLSTDLNGISMY